MPCSVCHQLGHNMRTCLLAKEKKSTTTKDKDKDRDKDRDRDKEIKNNQHFCYILQQVGKPHLCNYVGYTVNFGRRIRQHNQLIRGGARFTKNRGPWEFLVVMTCDSWNHIRGLQVEWLVKHPTRKIKRPPCFHGSAGRIRSLVEIVKRIPATESLRMYVHPAYMDMAAGLDLHAPVHFVPDLPSLSVSFN